MGSAALTCIMDDVMLNDIDIFIDNIEGFEDIHNYLVVQGYSLMSHTDMNDYSGMSLRSDEHFPIVVYKYKIPGNICDRDIQLISVKNVWTARELVDIAACQACFDGKVWTIPSKQLEYLNEKKTWLTSSEEKMSGYERICRVQKYEERGFEFIEKPGDEDDELVEYMENMLIE